ncbi:MAG: helix-turn-helix transcriptional regulator [bacterium]|nr:helix-turn-helix transcriptional regulator [bacterium]
MAIVRYMSNNRKIDVGRFAAMFKALSNPGRLKIFLRLVSCCPPGDGCSVESGRAYVGELGADMGLAPSTVSHHIKELRQAGLIEMSRSGQRIECRLPAKVLTDIQAFFGSCCCGDIDEDLKLPVRDPERS